MRERVFLLVHLISTIAKLLPPGGPRSIIAESLQHKHQLLILNRSRARAPNLRPIDRIITSLCAGLMHPARLLRSAIVLKPSTLMAFNQVIAGTPTLPQHLSSDHAPLFRCHRWQANLRILDGSEIKTVPHARSLDA